MHCSPFRFETPYQYPPQRQVQKSMLWMYRKKMRRVKTTWTLALFGLPLLLDIFFSFGKFSEGEAESLLQPLPPQSGDMPLLDCARGGLALYGFELF
ncbi:MAG: hypothetical protein LBH94_00330 [Deltaproteobacteria bacterium]|jgi:hypothetical protein|nr:hypothetical protein [Deltaproteobacteria bacterium]